MFNWLGKLLFGVDLKSLEKKVDDAQTAISQLKFQLEELQQGEESSKSRIADLENSLSDLQNKMPVIMVKDTDPGEGTELGNNEVVLVYQQSANGGNNMACSKQKSSKKTGGKSRKK